MFWIDATFGGHCPCLDSSLSSHIALGANKGNMMHCPIICTLCLRREMQPTNNNVMSLSSLIIFNFKICGGFLMTQPFFVKFVKIWRTLLVLAN